MGDAATIPRPRRLSLLQRYLIVVACIFAVLVVLAAGNKPKADELKKGVDGELTDYAKKHPDVALDARKLPQHEAQAIDFLVARSYTARLTGGPGFFFCYGAFHVTVCSSPD